MSRDVAPVIAARALLEHGIDDEDILRYVARTWSLDGIDAQSALTAARVLAQREPDPRTALPPEAGS